MTLEVSPVTLLRFPRDDAEFDAVLERLSAEVGGFRTPRVRVASGAASPNISERRRARAGSAWWSPRERPSLVRLSRWLALGPLGLRLVLSRPRSRVNDVSDPAMRERIALDVLGLVPVGWRIGQTSWNPGVHRWAVTARGPHPGRGKAQETISGIGEDELAAMTDLRIRLEKRRRANWPDAITRPYPG